MEIKPHEIRSVKLTKKNGLNVKFILASEEDGIATNKEYNYKNDRVPHSQFKSSIALLMGHAAILGDFAPKGHVIDAKYIKSRKIIDDPVFGAYRVVGFDIKEDMNGETVQLFINKFLPKGGVIEMKLPFVKLYEQSSYEFSGNLLDDLKIVLDETIEYMGGKYQESTQYALQLEDEDEQF